MTPELQSLGIRDLLYVVAIAEHQNFRLAARECAVSQPALSMQLKKVEELLDVEIFERTNREVIVTKTGERIVQQCRHILEELEGLAGIARGSDRPLEGFFYLGLMSTLGDYLLPALLSPLKKIYPSLKPIAIGAAASELLEQLRIGKLDAAIVPYPLPPKSGKFEVFPLFEETLLLAMHRRHRLAKKKRINAADIHMEDLVLLGEKHSLTQLTVDMFVNESSSESWSPAVEASELSSLCMNVTTSMHVAVVPCLASRAKWPVRDLCFRPFFRPEPTRRIALVWRPRYRGRVALRAFAPTFRDLAFERHPDLRPIRA